MNIDSTNFLSNYNSSQKESFGVPKEFSRLNSFDLHGQWLFGVNDPVEIKRRRIIIEKVIAKEKERIDFEIGQIRGTLNTYNYLDINEDEIEKEFYRFLSKYNQGFRDLLLSEMEEYYLKVLFERKGNFGNKTESQERLLESITSLLYIKFKLEYLRKKSLQEIKGSDDLHIGEIRRVINGEGSNGNVII